MTTNDLVILVASLYFSFAALMTIPRFLTRLAMKGIVRALEERNAVNVESALRVEELFPPSATSYPTRNRNNQYRWMALEALMRAKIVIATDDGRVSLAREKLHSYGLDKR